MTNVTDVDVDKIWIALGKWGRYQMRRLIIFYIAILSCSIHTLSIVFIGYKPDHLCREIEDKDANVSNTYVYGKCNIRPVANGSESVQELSCINGWSYWEDGEFGKEQSVVSEWDLVCTRKEMAELSQTLFMIGQGIGAFVFTSLSDRFGRKTVHVTCHIALFLTSLVTAFVPGFTYFAVLRLLLGTFQQGIGLTESMLIIEMVPKESRGVCEVAGLLCWTTGIAILTPIAFIFRYLSWRYLQICLSCLSAWSLIECWLCDESLRWLIANGRIADAKKIISKACKVNKKVYDNVVTVSGFRSFEMQFDMQVEVQKGDSKHTLEPLTRPGQNKLEKKTFKEKATKMYTALDLLKSKRLLTSSVIMWFAWITNSMTYYGIMLISSSLAGNRFLNYFLGSIVEYPAAFVELFMVNRYGRKPSAIVFHCVCAVSLIVATILFTTSEETSGLMLAATVFTLIGKFAITGSFSTIFLYMHELYPTNMRNVGLGMASTAGRIGGMVAPFSRNLVEVAVWGPGLIFAIMCTFVAFLMLWIPETNHYELPQTLEECERWYEENRFRLPCFKSEDLPESDQQTSRRDKH